MPVIQSEYECHKSFKNGHLQTIIPFFIRKTTEHKPEFSKLETPDGDFINTYLTRSSSKHLIIISHGLEGNGRDKYILDMKLKFAEEGYDVLSWDMRSCGGVMNHTEKFYNAYDIQDLELVINHFAKSYEKVSLMGISLGGALTTNYLGRNPKLVNPKVYRAFLLSAPMDLNASSIQLRQSVSQFIYRHVFIWTMKKKIYDKSKIMDLPVDINKVRQIKHIDEFDDVVTAPLYGYRNGEHYRKEASPITHLENVEIPLYILNAFDDPFLSRESYPFRIAKRKENIFLEVPKHGGHVGFIKSADSELYWYEKKVLDFLKMDIESAHKK